MDHRTGGRVGAVLLAAGLSSRFGRPKQLAELEGTALVRRAIETLKRSPVEEVVVVVGHRGSDVARATRGTGSKVVVNENYREGLGTSLKTGVAALGAETGAALICLADQPFVTPELVERIVARHRSTGAEVVVSVSGAVIKPPVLFARSLFGEIAELSGERGAKVIIRRHPGFERVVAGPDELLDVDTEEDLAKALEVIKRATVRRGKRTPAGNAP